ncbi:MAG: KEOPS complex subunit Pcc1 [Thermoplasmata archaeon]
MTATDWTVTIQVRCPRPEHAGWIARALAPEAAREVPRTRTELGRPDPDRLVLEIVARDSGAARAALNTYLGWIQLAERSLGVALAPPP